MPIRTLPIGGQTRVELVGGSRHGFRAVAAERHVAELPPVPGRLSVDMEMRSGDVQNGSRSGCRTDEVQHHARAARFRGTERQAGDRAEVVLELARLPALERPM